MKTRVTRLMLDKINLLSMCVCVCYYCDELNEAIHSRPAFRSPLESPANLQSENQQDKKKRKKNPTRAWEEHGNSTEIGTGKENRAACMGCAPACCHEPGEARTDPGLKDHSHLERYQGRPAVNDPFHLSLHWCLCTCSPDGRQRPQPGLEPPLAPLHFSPPPPNSASQKQRFLGSLCQQLKAALTCSTAEQNQAECVTGHFWVFSEPACCGVFGQEHYLLNLISCFLTGSNSNSGYKTAAAATVPTGFFFPPLLQLSSNTRLGTSEQLCLHWSV